jgi:hypothetical protein
VLIARDDLMLSDSPPRGHGSQSKAWGKSQRLAEIQSLDLRANEANIFAKLAERSLQLGKQLSVSGMLGLAAIISMSTIFDTRNGVEAICLRLTVWPKFALMIR